LGTIGAGDRLYWLPSSFSIETFWAPESIVGKPGITMDELDALVAQLGVDVRPFPQWMFKGWLFARAIGFALGNFVDEESGECWFDSPDFIAILKACNALNSDMSDELFAERDSSNSILDWDQISYIVRLGVISRFTGGDYCFVGFPNEGTNGSVFNFSSSSRFSISSASKHKDAAWSFVRLILSSDIQKSVHNLPIVRSEMEAQIENMLVNGENLGHTVYTITQSDADKFWELVDNTTVAAGRDPTLYDIIMEEAEIYFAGGSTAEKAAANIQNRAGTYLAERR
jgi:ABC-type glycerol-3-phosphate transport system substrate-binding protein